ncbi:MAG: MFS transporter [Candidatus Melainabacteria bacterium]|jgi:MFS family permease|nr:MFS transporter [Candidatus Melainabacteria bacterium]
MVASGYASLFRNKQFMCLWTAQIFSQFADRAVFVLFVAVLTAQAVAKSANQTVHAAELTSWLYVAFTIPAVVLSPFAGVCVDRWSNRAVLVVSNLIRAFFVALVALSWVKEYPKVAFTLAFLISIGAQFFGPAETASIPRLVKREDLYCANALFFTTMMIALGFGFAIGEPIIAHTGIGGAPYAVAGLFLIAAILLMGISDNKPQKHDREPWWEELRVGIAYIVDSPPVFRAILKITILFSTIITLNIIAVALVEQVMHLQPFQFGYVIAAAGLGMMIGNFWVGHQGPNASPRLMVYGGFSGLGLCMCLLGSLGFIQDHLFPLVGMTGVYFNGWLILVPLLFATLLGISCAFVAVPTQATLQAAVPEDLRGKVFGAQNTAMSAASTIPVILTGVFADNLPGGVSTTLFILGVPTFTTGIVQVLRAIRNPSLRSKL